MVQLGLHSPSSFDDSCWVKLLKFPWYKLSKCLVGYLWLLLLINLFIAAKLQSSESSIPCCTRLRNFALFTDFLWLVFSLPLGGIVDPTASKNMALERGEWRWWCVACNCLLAVSVYFCCATGFLSRKWREVMAVRLTIFNFKTQPFLKTSPF